MSLSTIDNIEQAGVGTVKFEWMMVQPPTTEEQALAIRQKVERLPLMMGTLVAEDNKATAIYVPIKDKNESYRISQDIQQHIDQLDSGDQYYMTGLPVA